MSTFRPGSGVRFMNSPSRKLASPKKSRFACRWAAIPCTVLGTAGCAERPMALSNSQQYGSLTRCYRRRMWIEEIDSGMLACDSIMASVA